MKRVICRENIFPATISGSVLIMFFSFFLTNNAACQSADDSESVFRGGSYKTTFSTSRVGVAQSVLTTPEGEFHLVIQHRFGDLSGGFYDFFGLDGAVSRFGFDYGINNWLSAGIGRTLFEKAFDLELKAVLLKQKEKGMPLSLSYYIEASEITQKDYFPVGHDMFGSRLTILNQLTAARNQGIFSLQASPMWLHSNYEIRNDKSMDIFALDFDGRVAITPIIGIFGEYIGVMTNESFIHENPITFGLDINTGGHQFQLVFSNSQGLNGKQFLTNTSGSWAKGNVYFGFNLTRVFNRKMD
jgi:hypothetical protein